MGNSLTNFLMAFFAAHIESQFLMSDGVRFQALQASLWKEHFTRSVLPDSFNGHQLGHLYKLGDWKTAES